MALTTYTTYDTIRALFGVTVRELKDEVLSLAIYETQFKLEMDAVDNNGGQVLVQYTAIAGMASQDRSTDQQRFLDLVNLLAAYSVARQLLGSDDNAVPLMISDGKAQVQRRPDNSRLTAAVEGGYNRFLKRLAALLLVLVPGATVTVSPGRTFIASIGIAVDPVIGT